MSPFWFLAAVVEALACYHRSIESRLPMQQVTEDLVEKSCIPAIRAFGAGTHLEAEGYVLENWQARRLELESEAVGARASFELQGLALVMPARVTN